MRRPATAVAALALATASLHGAAAAAQEGAVSAARAAVIAREARQTQDTEGSERARALLTAGLERCETGAGGRGCREVLHFNRAYLAQQAAAGAESRSLLEQAAADYRAVLRDAPGHAPTLNNLARVYARLGPRELSPEMLREAAAADPDRASGYLVLLGDHHRLAGSFDAARDAYLEALRRSEQDAAPLYRLVALYREEAPGQAAALREVLDAAADRFPDAAAEGYAAVVAALHARDPADAERALLRWTALRARGRLEPASLAELPAGWRPPAVVELERYLRDPWTPPTPPSWWLAAEERREVLAGVALALGGRMVLDGEPRAAERCWSSALEFAPSDGGTTLELARELASLYYRSPSIDEDGRKLRELEARLYEGKGSAIESQDLPAMQRFHTVLGLLYAERGVWRSDRPWTNAIFQLERALEAAVRREPGERLFQPLPLLRARLADGYAELGRRDEARQSAILAARAYLDTDDLETAGAMLERAAGEPEPTRTRQIHALRSRLAAEDAGAAAACSAAAIERAFAVDDPALEQVRRLESDREAFASRQRFKVLADCARRVEPAVARGYAAAALALAQEPDEATAPAPQAARPVYPAAREAAPALAPRLRAPSRSPAALLTARDVLRLEEAKRLAGRAGG